MKKLQLYKTIFLFATPLILTFFIIVLYIYPGFAVDVPDFRYLFIWVALATLGGSHINRSFLKIVEEIGDEEKINLILSPRGRTMLKRDPEYFFTHEQHLRYQKWQRTMIVFFLILCALLFVVLNVEEILQALKSL